jgi:hypothetical protein
MQEQRECRARVGWRRPFLEAGERIVSKVGDGEEPSPYDDVPCDRRRADARIFGSMRTG